MKTTSFLPLGVGLAAWFMLAAMVGVTLQRKPADVHVPAVAPRQPQPVEVRLEPARGVEARRELHQRLAPL